MAKMKKGKKGKMPFKMKDKGGDMPGKGGGNPFANMKKGKGGKGMPPMFGGKG